MRGMKVRVVLGLLGVAVAITCDQAVGQAAVGQALVEDISTQQPVPGLPTALSSAKSRQAPVRQTSYQLPSPIQQASLRLAFGQPPVGAVPSFGAPATAAVVPGHASRAIAYFGGGAAAQTHATMPSRLSLPARVSTSIGPPKPRSKPFAAASNGATISPYLNLFRDETVESAPNYYAFVRPQLRQRELNRQQQSQLQTLQRRVQKYAQKSSAGPRQSATGAPLTGHRTRYMDTGGYFSGVGK